MRMLLVNMAVLILATAPATAGEGPIGLDVLYAGRPGSDRERDFVAFLRGSFRAVATADYETFDEDRARGHDVVVLDWPSIYPRDAAGKIPEQWDRLEYPRPPRITEAYSRPTILVGASGQNAVEPLRLKLDSLCVCLGDAAHGISLGHEVFREPLAVAPSFEDRPTPPNYRALSAGEPIGPTIKVWKVQSRGYPDLDPGVVSNPFGFDDSPDCETIAAGLSLKGPRSVALGRQGNFFLWGFSAAPGDLTPEARRCLINSICYIRRFDGQRPIVRRGDRPFSRDHVLTMANLVRTYADPDLFRKLYPMNEELALKDPSRFEARRKAGLRQVEGYFPEDVRETCRDDASRYDAWVRENFDWLRPGEDPEVPRVAIDEDVRSLGLSNHKVELLDRCISMLERGDRPELAARVLGRYTAREQADASGWRAWVTAARDRLFFTEAGGYRFLEAPASPARPSPPAGVEPARKPASPKEGPIVAEVSFSPARARAGEVVMLTVRVEASPSWHISAVRDSKGPEMPTRLSLALPRGIDPEGDWILPVPEPRGDGRLVHEGRFEFRRRLRVAADVAIGPGEIEVSLGYQACNAFMCRPPAESRIQANLPIGK